MIRYRDKLGYDREVYRLQRHGVFIGEYRTPEELAGHVDVAELVPHQAPQRSEPGETPSREAARLG